MRCRRLRPLRDNDERQKSAGTSHVPKAITEGSSVKHPSVNRRGNSGYHRGDSGGQHHEKWQSRTSTIRHKKKESRQHARSQKSPCAHRHDREARETATEKSRVRGGRRRPRGKANPLPAIPGKASNRETKARGALASASSAAKTGRGRLFLQAKNPYSRRSALCWRIPKCPRRRKSPPRLPEKQVGYGKFAEQSSPRLPTPPPHSANHLAQV